MLLAFFFFAVTYAQSQCANGGRSWKSSCTLLTTQTACLATYAWNVNYTTANYIGVPSNCLWDSFQALCLPSGLACYPKCVLDSSISGDARHKLGGPNGWVCSTFSTQSSCANAYVNDYGDRWCFWNNGVCNTGTLCYN